MAPKVLYIGLGNMGKGMCKNLASKARLDGPLLVFNRTTERAEELVAALGADKAQAVTSVADGVARADVVFLSLGDDRAVRATVEAILQGDVGGKLVVDTSTIHPDTTEEVGRLVTAAGAEFVAGPVFGAPAVAEAGQLVGVLAGPRASVDRALPFFRGVTSRADIDMGGEPWAKASLLKLAGNSFVLNMVEQIAEGHVLAEKTGLGTGYLHQLLEHLFPAPYPAYSARMLSGDYWRREAPLFAVDLARKDAGHALRLAGRAGARLPNLETVDAHLAKVKEHAGAKGDVAGIYGAVRAEAGLKFENDA